MRTIKQLVVLLILTVLVIAVVPGTPASAAGGWPVDVITASNWSYGVGDVPQRHVYYAASRWWVWYASGPGDSYHIQLLSSADGKTNWTVEDTGVTFDYSNCLSTAYDGTYFHYGRQYGGAIYYRRGEPQSDGSIVWSAAEQTAVASGVKTGNWNQPTSLAVSDTGHVFIGYADETNGYSWVTMNDNTDGTWSTNASHPYQLKADTYYYPIIVPLTAGKVYAIIPKTSTYGRLFDGSWQGEETVSTTPNIAQFWSATAVSHGDIVEFVFKRANPNYQLRCCTRSASGTWTETTDLTDGLDTNARPNVTLWGDSDLRVYYCLNDKIYSLTRGNGNWESTPTEVVDETADTIYEPNYENSVSFNSVEIGNIPKMSGVAYITGSSTYNLRFLVDYEMIQYTGFNPTVAAGPTLFVIVIIFNVGLFGYASFELMKNGQLVAGTVLIAATLVILGLGVALSMPMVIDGFSRMLR